MEIVIDTSIPSGRVVRTLDQLVEWRGRPNAIRVDNGPEYLSQIFADWCRDNAVMLNYIQPGKPNQNAYVLESLTGKLTDLFWCKLDCHGDIKLKNDNPKLYRWPATPEKILAKTNKAKEVLETID